MELLMERGSERGRNEAASKQGNKTITFCYRLALPLKTLSGFFLLREVPSGLTKALLRRRRRVQG